MHLLQSGVFKVFTVESLHGLTPNFEDFGVDSLAHELIVFDLVPVNLAVFRSGHVNDTEFSVVPNLAHFPLKESLVVVGE
jgi:hypothetical protein